MFLFASLFFPARDSYLVFLLRNVPREPLCMIVSSGDHLQDVAVGVVGTRGRRPRSPVGSPAIDRRPCFPAFYAVGREKPHPVCLFFLPFFSARMVPSDRIAPHMRSPSVSRGLMWGGGSVMAEKIGWKIQTDRKGN